MLKNLITMTLYFFIRLEPSKKTQNQMHLKNGTIVFVFLKEKNESFLRNFILPTNFFNGLKSVATI
ncbi:hypothetical protein DCO46_17930 [Flavobacterium sp. HTF]|nr:hypothetical protein DCO46_17930 [Flavobacterium sp. HTF]